MNNPISSKIIRIITALGVMVSFMPLLFGQEASPLTLKEVITLSEKESIDAFRRKNLYQRNIYQFQNFKANGLPTLNLSLEPLTLNRRVEQRFNSRLGRDEFRTIETLTSNVGLRLSQNILATGGRIALNTSVNRFENIGDIENLSFNTNLVRLSLEQTIFGYNRFKWSKKIEPLRYEKAKGEFIEQNEALHIKATELYFDLATADLNVNNTIANLKNAEKLYNIGKERFKIATVNQEELLDLELNVLNTQTTLQRAKRQLMDRQFEFNIFLGFNENEKTNLNVPKSIPLIEIDMLKALEMAKQNSSQILDLKLNELNASDRLAQAKANRRITPNLDISVGLNNTDSRFPNTLTDPLTQNRVSLRVDIPIINWSVAKRRVLIAENNSKIANRENLQNEKEYLQNVRTQVIDFNLQKDLVANALKAKEVAVKSYNLDWNGLNMVISIS